MPDRNLIVVIPAYDEEQTITSVIERIPTEIRGIRSVRTVVVDDGSMDKTRELAEQAGATVLSHERNYGVGKAYQTGLNGALGFGADIIVNIDADGQFDPEEIKDLVAPIVEGTAEFVTASRFIDKTRTPKMTFARYWGNRVMSFIVSRIVGKRFYDVSCGFRACSREAALRLNLSGTFTYTQETFLELAAKGIAIKEIPMTVQGTRSVGKSRVASNLFKYGNRTMRIIVRAYKDYWPWQFFSSMGAVCFVVAILLGGFLMYWRITQGKFRPHIWSGFVGGFFFIMGTICVLMGMFGDMLRRIRMNVEQLLYFQKKDHYSKPDGSGHSGN